MTARQAFEAILIELNKQQAPSLLLEDYNYFMNKAINQYVNKRYNIYDINQQTTDDLRVLKSTQVLKAHKKATDKYAPTNNDNSSLLDRATGIFGATYEVELPLDYLHMLNCICEFIPKQTFKCYDEDYPIYMPAHRLDADMYGAIINNFYMRPMYKRPYYYIHNVNVVKGNDALPINTNHGATNVDKYGKRDNIDSTATLTIGGQPQIERVGDVRYGNAVAPRLEIRYGTDDTLFVLSAVYIDYLKAPKTIRLTQAQIDKTADTSQLLEFPDYVVQEIINEAVMLVMENASDPRLQSTIPVSQSIAQPQSSQPAS